MRLVITYIVLCCSLFIPSQLSSQSTFKSYFGEGIPLTENYDIIATDDGGFIISGNTTEFGNINFYVIKIDENGKEDWSFIHDFDLGAFYDICIDAVELTDYFAITTVSWRITEDPEPYSFVLLLNKMSGELEQIIPIIDFPRDCFAKIDKTSNEDLVLFGVSNDTLDLSPSAKLMTLVKIDNTDDIIWSKTYPETKTTKADFLSTTDFFIDEEDYFYLAGGGRENDTLPSELYLIKTDIDGNLLWQTDLYNTARPKKMTIQSDGIILTTNHSDGDREVIIKIALNGEVLWKINFEAYVDKIPSCVSNEQDEIFILGEKYNNDENINNIILLKTDPDGNLIWQKEFIPSLPIDKYYPIDIVSTEDGGVVITGSFAVDYLSTNAPSGIFVYRLNAEGEFGDILDTSSTPLFNTASIDIFPNPTTDKIRIQNQAEQVEEYLVTLYDMQANKIHQTTMLGAQSDIQMKQFPAGSYILELRNQKNQAYRKLVVKQ